MSKLLAIPVDSIDSPNTLCDAIFESISHSLDDLAPVQYRKTTLRPNRYKIPWSPEIAEAKRLKRRYERLYSKSKLDIHKQLARSQTLLIRSLVKQEMASTVQSKILNCANSKELFAFYNRNTKSNKGVLPIHDNDDQLASDFGAFFTNKVTKITQVFDTTCQTYNLHVTADSQCFQSSLNSHLVILLSFVS
jgi:hypothetical protein